MPTATYTDETRMIVRVDGDGRSSFVPVDAGNRHYAALVASGVSISDPPSPITTEADLVTEYTRRLVALLGARDLAHAGFIRADDLSERLALAAMSSPTAEQASRLAELQARDAAVAALIDAYNAVPTDPVPSDFAAASRWP